MSDDEVWFDDFDDSLGGDLSQGSPCPTDSDEGADAPLPGEPPSSAQSKARLYTIIDRPSLHAIQREALDQVQGILGCDTTTARALLTHFSWDAESVLGTIAERGQDEVYKRCGLLSRAPEGAQPLPSRPGTRRTITCGVCMSDVPAAGAEAMACGHAFCRDCWRQHLRMGVQEGLSRRLRCMAPSCGVVCSEDKVRALLEPTMVDKYDQALLESYVDDNRRVKWCPSVPHCGHAVLVPGDAHCEVQCGCGQSFCFACSEVPHSPATCAMLRNWLQRYRDGSETSSWLSANTKPCPKCAKPVEKAGGCNLVVCRCGQAFCWLCGQGTGRAHTWTSIEGHSCGAYRDAAETKASEAQRTLNRYLHYVTRYEAHLASLRWEERARGELEHKITAMIEASASLGNYAWLQAALEQLFLARRVLAYSYIFAFYMFGGGEAALDAELPPARAAVNQALFEDKQGQLEGEVERLAKLVESTPAEGIPGERLSIINAAATINTRIVKMYDVIENDIAAQLAASSLDIAPYRGQRTPGSGGEVYRPGSGGGGGGAGPSSSRLPADQPQADVVDLTAEQSDDSPAGGKGKGQARAGSKRLRKG